MAKKRPFGFVGIIAKDHLLDVPVEKTVFEILRDPPTKPNEIGLGIFCLPADAVISLPKFVTSWIIHIPNGLVCHLQADPDDKEEKQHHVWFDLDVVCITDGAGDRETRFLMIGTSEIPIRVNKTQYLATAHKTREEAQAWVDAKTTELVSASEQLPS